MSELFAFAARHPGLSLAFVVISIAWLAWEVNLRRRGFRGLNNNELSHWMNRKDAIVIDLSSNNDFLKGHIPGALNIASSELAPANHASLKKDRPVVLYDRSGREAERACAQLKKQGFAEVGFLEGGLDGWLRESLPVVKGR
jgi:rhodanese-related sulfurtransferase